MFSIRRSLGHLARIAKSFKDLIKDPLSPETYFSFQESLLVLAGPADLEQMADAFRSTPGIGNMIAGRYLSPEYRVEDLSGCAPGTLGHAYYRFMTDNGLSKDYIVREWPKDDLGYLWQRSIQTHDFWHVMLGYQPDFLGEFEISAFAFSHAQKSLTKGRFASGLIVGALLLAFALHGVAYKPAQVRRLRASLVAGLSRGVQVRPLWDIRWEELWHRPLAELRTEYLAA